jgi:hypothetical protein
MVHLVERITKSWYGRELEAVDGMLYGMSVVREPRSRAYNGCYCSVWWRW